MLKNNKVITPQLIRRIILAQSKRAGVGHIGSSLSVADIIATLYGQVMTMKSPDDPKRDRFILSKGHAALAQYAALSLRGWLSPSELNTFCGDNTFLGVHPEHDVPGIEFSTGSLGQGLSFGVGVALAAKLKRGSHRVFVLLSDAECNEGSTWEAVMVAAHHRLSNLTAIIDVNAQQAFGYTKDVLNLEPLTDRWQAFGWDTVEVDGHSVAQLKRVLNRKPSAQGRPRVVLARTTFGKGVSYMENKIKWHYWPMSDEDYRIAVEEIG